MNQQSIEYLNMNYLPRIWTLWTLCGLTKFRKDATSFVLSPPLSPAKPIQIWPLKFSSWLSWPLCKLAVQHSVKYVFRSPITMQGFWTVSLDSTMPMYEKSKALWIFRESVSAKICRTDASVSTLRLPRKRLALRSWSQDKPLLKVSLRKINVVYLEINLDYKSSDQNYF